MKKFRFPLERVLAWRHTQARLEQARLDRATVELREMELMVSQLAAARHEASKQLLNSHGAIGIEFQALGPFKAASEAQEQQISRKAAELRLAIEQQTRVVVERRRDAKLLERLREQRLNEWSAVAAKEIEQQSEESYLSRWSGR